MKASKKINISIILSAALIILIGVFIIYPSFKEIQKSAKDLFVQKEKLAFLEAKIDNLDKLKKDYKEFEDKLDEFNSLFADSEVPIDFIGFLEEISANNGMETKISPISIKGNRSDSWSFLGFQIKTDGSFSDLLVFLEKLEAAPFLIEIENLSIEGDAGNITATFSLKVYTNVQN